ncbi:class I SAM-dependent methyltransferase [Methanobacterium alcaliphilum]|uniref:class I SAM-dependent methyltransferase n=1 Tax=Methanobacterium alcaliphilum TaxID=392018 RepID=UPI00200B9B64|nr:class I SAM-dependent methyltransferase [Methanobacterium alcaliphilum]
MIIILEKKHVHHGKSSREFIDAEEVLIKMGVKESDIFLDAGCGDGHISLEASKFVGESGNVYAVDIYEDSIDSLKGEIKSRGVKNISAITADITSRIPLANNEVDYCLMANVFHGFVENNELKESIHEITRIIKPGGILAILDFKKIENSPGPPLSVRVEAEDVVYLLEKYNFKKVRIENVGKFHYMLLLKLIS